MITREFQLHIDPSLYGFKFTGAQYATVKYMTTKEGLNMVVEVFELGMGPLLYCAITDREKLVTEAEAAARKNAQQYWNEQECPLITNIIKGFAPHI